MAEVTLNVVSPTNKTTSATAKVVVWTKPMALRKGINWWLTCWAIAIFTIAIPIVHFFSVPILLFLGPVLGFIIYKLHTGTVELVDGKGTCPDCSQTLLFENSTDTWPLTIKCLSCAADLTVSKKV